MKPGRRPWRPAVLLADRRGAAAVEFAIVLPFLLLLVVGLIDYGLGFWEQMMVGNAARAGAYFASVNGWGSGAPGSIETAVTSATSLASISASGTYAPSQACYCPTSSGLVAPPGTPTAPGCGATLCSDGVTPAGYYIVVNAGATYNTLMPWPGIGSNFTLTATSFARID